MTQPQYNRTACEAEITLENQSEVVLCADDPEGNAIPSVLYNVCVDRVACGAVHV